MRHIPNILSGFRIILVGVFAWLFCSTTLPSPNHYWWALGVYVLAFLTDILDGFLARTFHWVTPVGKLLDPLADKLMSITALIVILVARSRQDDGMFGVYVALFVLFVVKELLMMAGGLVMLKHRKVAYSDWYGKAATGIFAIGTVLTLLRFPLAETIEIEPWNIAVLAAAVALSYVAMTHYARTQLFTSAPKEAAPDEEKLFEKVDRLMK